MPRDTLTTLIKVRQMACDEAMRSLVGALENEDRAMRTAHEIERAIAHETEAAADLAGTDVVVEAFGQWLQNTRRQLATAQATLLGLQVETTRKRAELTACKTALESVEALQQQRREKVQLERTKKSERELEDRPPSQDGPTANYHNDI